MGNCIKYDVNHISITKMEKDNSNTDYLNTIEYRDTIPFVPPVSKGKVVKVYDGDTITIASKVDNLIDSPIYRFSVRLNGIDTPEIKGKTEEEKEIAKKARDDLSRMILGKIITLKNVETEKYGRLLAEVYFEETHINQWMIDNRYAVKYGGGTKQSPDNWKDYHENKI